MNVPLVLSVTVPCGSVVVLDVAPDASVTPEQAIYEAAVVRFRPIMMTTMAALMGTLPIAFGTGAGAESRRPLGLCVAGGLLLGLLEAFAAGYLSSQYKDAVAFIVILLVLLVVPRGLLGKPSVERV